MKINNDDMKNKFITQLAQDVIKQNIHWKEEYQKIQLRIKDYQSLIMQTLKSLTQNISIDYPIDNDPYICLKQFTNAFTKISKCSKQQIKQIHQLKQQIKNQKQIISQLKLNNLSYQNIIQSKQNQLYLLQQESQAKIKYGINIINQLNKDKQKLKTAYQKLQANYLNVQSYHLNQNKKKINQLIRQHKNQFLSYRKTIQEESWKIQQALRLENQKQSQQIRKLLVIINDFSKKQNNHIKTQHIQGLAILMKPYQDHFTLSQKVSELKKQISLNKNQLRNQLNNRLQIQNKYQSIKNTYQQLKQQYQVKKKIFLNCQKQNQIIKEQIQKIKIDKDNLTYYYQQKWVKDFNAVRQNLQKKNKFLQNNLIKEYQQKKNFIQLSIQSYTSENSRLKIQRLQLQDKIENLQKLYNKTIKQNFQLLDKINSIKSQLRQSQIMHQEDEVAKIILERQEIKQLNIELQQLRYKMKYQKQVDDLKIKKKQCEIKWLKIQSQQDKKTMTKKYQSEILQLKIDNSNKQNKITQIMDKLVQLSQSQKLKKQYQRMLDQLKIQNKMVKQSLEKQKNQCLTIKQRFLKREKQNEIRIKQILIQKQKQISQLIQKQKQVATNIDKKQQLIQQTKQNLNQTILMKKYQQKQISDLKQVIKHLQVKIKSLSTIISSKQSQIQTLNKNVNDLDRFVKELNSINSKNQKQFKELLKEVRSKCQNLIDHYRGKVRQLQKLLDGHPISQKDHQKLRELILKNQALEDKISMKQAQNLILLQIKSYYQSKLQQNQIKLAMQLTMRDKTKSIFIKRPRKGKQILLLKKQYNKTQNKIFDSKQIVQIKKYIRTKRKYHISPQVTLRQRNKSSMI